MASLRSNGRNLSFEILSRNSSLDDQEAAAFYRSNSDPIQSDHHHNHKPPRKKRNKKKKKTAAVHTSIPESPTTINGQTSGIPGNGLEFSYSQTVLCSSVTTEVISDPEFQKLRGNAAELRQRTIIGTATGGGTGTVDETETRTTSCRVEGGEAKEESAVETGGSVSKQRSEPNGNAVPKLQTAESLDWKRLMAEDPNYLFSVDKSPVKYFMEEMSNGNSLRSTTTLGNEKERERVYDTIFRLPWRCELLIDFKRPSAAELSDFGSFTIMACGVTLLEQTDISLIYHMIRGQGTIKLYVVYNVLEIFDKLCQSFNPDVLQTLFNSAEGLASCPPENMRFWIWRFICDQALAVAASIVHSFILLAQAITLSTCIVAHNNALLALLVSNNFAEIKSNVFKRYSKDNIHSLVYFDSVERFHISAFVLFVLAQNILEAEGPWFESFLSNALLVYVCEMIIDIIKHSFIAKFNDIKPIVYSEFLEDLCKQTLNIQSEASKKNLTFIPLAPACVVIRVLTPVYAAHLPYSPLPWKLFWILVLFAMTYVMLTSLKVLIGMGLQKHASWYVNRCRRRKHHLHYD